MKKLNLLLAFAFCIMLSSNFAQEEVEQRPNYAEEYNRVISLLESDRIVAALKSLKNFNVNDSVYIESVFLRYKILRYQKKYEKIVDLADELLVLDSSYYHLSMIYKLEAFFADEEYDKVVELADEALEMYPLYESFWEYKAVAYAELEEYQKSYDAYEQMILINPYSPTGHRGLLNALWQEEAWTQFLMSAYMLCYSVGSEESDITVLTYTLPLIIGNTRDGGANGIETGVADGEFFELDRDIADRLFALKSFEIPYKTKSDLIKALVYMIENLEDVEVEEDNVWSNYYLPFFQKLKKDDNWFGFALRALKYTEAKPIKKTRKKYSEALMAFEGSEGHTVYPIWNNFETEVEGEKLMLTRVYVEGSLDRAGQIDAETKEETGLFYYYDSRGFKRAEGQMVKGEKEGEWKYFFADGRLNATEVFENGELNGEVSVYYRNGNKKLTHMYKDGEKTDSVIDFAYNGDVEFFSGYADEKLEGEAYANFKIGLRKFDLNYASGKLDGKFVRYFDNGDTSVVSEYKEGELNGTRKSFFRNGQLSVIANYKEGELEGERISYYKDGKVAQEGSYKEGKEIGEHKSYYRTGELEQTSVFDESGKLSGTMKILYKDGTVKSTYEYKKGELVSLECFDKTGKSLANEMQNGGSIAYKSFYDSGKLYLEGAIKGEDRAGEWKYYFENGGVMNELTYVDGEIEGYYYSYNEIGKLLSKEGYKAGVLNGLIEAYYPTGKVKVKGYFEDGNREGPWTWYFANGKVSTENYYVNGDLDGVQFEYNVKGEIMSIEKYEDGALMQQKRILSKEFTDVVNINYGNGPYIMKYANGQVKFEGNYVNSVAHGDFKWYYPDGSVETTGAYFNDEKTGEWIWYYQNGEISQKGSYERGSKVGEWKDFDKKGNLTDHEFYDENGDETGTWKRYHNNVLVYERTFKEGYLEGEAREYDYFGKLLIVKYFEEGTFVAYSYEGRDGKLVDRVELKNESGVIFAKFASGDTSVYYKLENGFRDKDYLEYYSNGQLFIKRFYKDGYSYGTSYTYFANGQVRTEIPYKRGVREGNSLSYYENGKLKSTTSYKYGEAHGDYKYFDEAGKLLNYWIYNTGEVAGFGSTVEEETTDEEGEG